MTNETTEVNVVSFDEKWNKSEVRITMPYIGRALSINYYKIVGRGGRKTNKTRPETEAWMKELAEKVRTLGLESNSGLTIKLTGGFRDERFPDLANLHKILGDAIEMGCGINDKYYKFIDLDVYIRILD